PVPASPPEDQEMIVIPVELPAAVDLTPVDSPVAEEPVAEVSVADEMVGEAPPHTAPHDEIIAVVHELLRRSPSRPVTLDSLANALKSRGFSRPAGSPRLITRLRRIKEISLSRWGVITLLTSGGASSPEPPSAPAPEAAGDREAESVEPDVGPEPGNEALPRAEVVHRPGPSRYRPRRSAWSRHRPAPASAPA